MVAVDPLPKICILVRLSPHLLQDAVADHYMGAVNSNKIWYVLFICCVVDNVIYMGIVNNSNNAWHVSYEQYTSTKVLENL